MMVIDEKDFEKRKITSVRAKMGPNQEKILGWLKRKEMPYCQAEIQHALGMRYEGAVNSALHSLRRRGLITCKKINGVLYWRYNSEETKVVLAGSEENKRDSVEAPNGHENTTD